MPFNDSLAGAPLARTMLHYKNSSEYIPLARRIYTTKPSRVPQPSTKEWVFNRPTHYKVWTEENIRLACDAVKVDGYTYRRAELEFGIPKSTIRDRISGRTLPGATSGPERYLSKDEEQELTHFIKECAKLGYAKTRKQIIAMQLEKLPPLQARSARVKLLPCMQQRNPQYRRKQRSLQSIVFHNKK